jgi:hypothetical protein
MADYVVPADLIDDPDKLKMLIDPQSAYAQNQAFSLNRQIDDCIITALGGPAYGGHEGGTTINNYDIGECRLIESSGVIAAAGSDWSDTVETALTIAKLLTCKRLLDDAEIDPERQRYFVTNPYNIGQLLNTTEVKSADYNTVKALAQGQIDTFMGFKFIMSTRLPADDTDTGATKCYAFAQDAIVLAIAEEPNVHIDRRPDLLNSVQVFSTLSIGCTRVEGPAVVGIESWLTQNQIARLSQWTLAVGQRRVCILLPLTRSTALALLLGMVWGDGGGISKLELRLCIRH